LVEAVTTATANEHDSHGLKPVVKKVPESKKEELQKIKKRIRSILQRSHLLARGG
jgi:hypothetical protein